MEPSPQGQPAAAPAPAANVGKPPTWPQRLETSAKAILAMAGVAGIAAYAIIWAAYAQFYGPLGLTPEAIGLDKAQLLGEALVGPFVIMVAKALEVLFWESLIVAVICVAALLVTFGTRLRQSASSTQTAEPHPRVGAVWKAAWSSFRSDASEAVKVVVPFIFSVALLWGAVDTAVLLYQRAQQLGINVATGTKTVAPLGVSILDGAFTVPTLQVTALQARVLWLDGKAPATMSSFDPCLLYLGQVEGQVILYQTQDGTILRVPSSNVTLSVDERVSSLPLQCHRLPDTGGSREERLQLAHLQACFHFTDYLTTLHRLDRAETRSEAKRVVPRVAELQRSFTADNRRLRGLDRDGAAVVKDLADALGALASAINRGGRPELTDALQHLLAAQEGLDALKCG
jgi:hypothetical protein